jgi:hypothetical protein
MGSKVPMAAGVVLPLPGEWLVEEAAIAYGGVAPKTIMAQRTQAALLGQPWSEATLRAALAAVAQDVNITPNAPGALPACCWAAQCCCSVCQCAFVLGAPCVVLAMRRVCPHRIAAAAAWCSF